jgi:uncharacterized protein (TIGR03437 family)
MKPVLLGLILPLLVRSAAPVTTLANFPNSIVYAVQTDATGNVYVAGMQGNFTKANPFAAKLSPTGETLYSTTLAGSNFGIAWALAIDSKGAAYIFGNTNSPDFPVTPGALQTTMQGSFQGFVSKLDPSGKVVYSTFIGGATDVTPGLTSAPGLDSILVDPAGDVILTGQAGTNSTTGVFPPAPAPVVSGSESFVLKLDPTGSKILGGISGVGGLIAMDGEGNIYVTGVQNGVPINPLAVTPGAFQSEPVDVCSQLGAFFTCSYPYVAKLNPGLNQILYSTYVSGKYGGTPAAISVDAAGDAFVAGTTNSPDYPTTPDAYEPHYIAAAIPKVSCFFIKNCHNLPPPSGYFTEVNPTGTGLVYSTYFSGTQTDTITFAALTGNAIYVAGSAGSADLPGFAGFPQQCLPAPYATRLSANGTEIGATRIVPGRVLAYDAFAGTVIAWTGSSVVSVRPDAPQAPIACILDGADFGPVTSIAPGELLSLFGEFSSGAALPAPSGTAPASLGGYTVDVAGIASPLLYVSSQQINFQVPFAAAVAPQAEIDLANRSLSLSDSLSLPIVAINPTAFVNPGPLPPSPLETCTMVDSASVNGLLPVALNADASLNTCLNAAPAGSTVTLFLQGLGSVSAPVVTANKGMTVTSVSPLPAAVSGVWKVNLQIPSNAGKGGNQVSLTAGGVAVRDASLVIWVR